MMGVETKQTGTFLKTRCLSWTQWTQCWKTTGSCKSHWKARIRRDVHLPRKNKQGWCYTLQRRMISLSKIQKSPLENKKALKLFLLRKSNIRWWRMLHHTIIPFCSKEKGKISIFKKLIPIKHFKNYFL